MSALKRAVDNTLAFLSDRKKAYQLSFTQPAGQAVLRDLLKYSHYAEGPFGKDDRETNRLIGRLDVVLRIAQHVGLSQEQLFALYNGTPVPIITSDKEDTNADT